MEDKFRPKPKVTAFVEMGRQAFESGEFSEATAVNANGIMVTSEFSFGLGVSASIWEWVLIGKLHRGAPYHMEVVRTVPLHPVGHGCY